MSRYKLTSVVISILLLIISKVYAQQINYEKNWSVSYSDKLFNIINADNKFISTGITYRDSIPFDTLGYYPQYPIKKIDLNGNHSNIKILNSNDTIYINNDTLPIRYMDGELYHIGYFNGRVFITGIDRIGVSPIQVDNFVMSLDTNGNIVWFQYLNRNPYTQVRGIYDMQVLPNGDIHVLGWISSGSDADSYLVKLDEFGNIKYSNRYYFPGYQAAYKVSKLSSGALLLTGVSDSSAMFFKVNLETGDSVLLHTSLTIPGADNSYLVVKYFEERSDFTYLSIIYDGQNQGYICYLDTNFSFLNKHIITGDYNNFFRVSDNEYIGYNSNSPVSIYSFDSIGSKNWVLNLTKPEKVSFVPDVQGGMMGAGYVDNSSSTLDFDFYLVRIDSVGFPAGPICHNPPTIHWAHADIVGANYANLSDSATENLKYSDVLAHNWYFQDGEHAYGQYVSHQIDAILYPDSFWCMLVVTDAIGCTDTLTINAYTNEVIYPNPDWPPNSVDEKIASVPRNDVRLFPNPAQNTVIVQHGYTKGVLELLNHLGQVIHQQQITGKQTVLDLNGHPNGLYFVKLSSPGEMTVVKKLVISK